jgi:hypothetical protein
VKRETPGRDAPTQRTVDDLAREANRVRSKLLGTIDQLRHRGEDVRDLRLQLRRHARQLLLLGGALIVVTAGGVALVVQRMAAARSRRRRERWSLAKSMWRHPERALRGERRTVLGQVLRSVLVSVLTALVTIPARRAVLALLPSVADGEGEGEGHPHEAH